MRLLALLLTILGLTIMTTNADAKKDLDLENTLYLELKDGRVVIEMKPDVAPNHVKRVKELVRDGFYDGLTFHRVIDGFMAQTGDPKGDGTGGSGHNLKAEFSDAKHLRGTVSMARAGHPDSADSQFFIVFKASEWLDGQYTVWGQVVDGMEHVDAIKKGAAARNGEVSKPDKIISMKVAADVEGAGAAAESDAQEAEEAKQEEVLEENAGKATAE